MPQDWKTITYYKKEGLKANLECDKCKKAERLGLWKVDTKMFLCSSCAIIRMKEKGFTVPL